MRDAVAVLANTATPITATAKPTSFVMPSPHLFDWASFVCVRAEPRLSANSAEVCVAFTPAGGAMYSRMRPRSRSPGGVESLRHGRRPQVHGLVVARNRFVGKLRGDACPARAATAGAFECCDVVDATVPVALVRHSPCDALAARTLWRAATSRRTRRADGWRAGNGGT